MKSPAEPRPVIDARAEARSGTLSSDAVATAFEQGLSGRLSGQKVLVLIPDHTRSVPLADLFRLTVEVLSDAARIDFMVALGTHPPLSDESLLRLVGLSPVERATEYAHVGLMNHAWNDPGALATLGTIETDEIREIAGQHWHPSLPDRIQVRINRAILDYDHVLILGPTFPHEVVGFSGGAKYLFPGISGPEMIDATHWLGALAAVVGTIGVRDTPVRTLIHAAARRVPTPVSLAALVVVGDDLAGVFIGDLIGAWEAAVELSSQRHIRWCERPYRRVLSCAPPMYDELWTAAKAMYKLEPAVDIGGEVVIFAPHLDTVSRVHGQFLDEIGYHTLPYFLEHWDRYRHIPLGVLAHSTHLRGSGRMESGIEKANVRVTLASRIPRETCERLNLGYLNPDNIDISGWQNRDDEGILYVPKAGEILYRLT
jgi:nickel-dependent lactate racemase